MQNISFENKLKNWIKEISDKETVPENIKALNFGIFESENGYTMYLTGSEEYDEEDDDWACSEDFVPENKYLEFDLEEVNSLDWEEYLDLTADTLRNILNSEDLSELKVLNVENIATGFDDGDLVKVK